MAFKSFEKTLEENNSLLSFLNTYTEYFINGILQHCKHIVRLNVHVCVCVFGTLWGLHSSSCTTHFGLSLKLGFRGNVRVLDRTLIRLQSCVNTCKQTESSSSGSLAFQVDLIKYVKLAGKWIAYEELDSLFLFENHSKKQRALWIQGTA